MKSALNILCLMTLLVPASSQVTEATFTADSRPYARYWWFASMIQEEDVRYNLDWLKANGFGGVEIAWVYPLNRSDANDAIYTPRQEWLSNEWASIVDFSIRYADSIGLGCDLTFGTLWPFGDSQVAFNQATQHYDDSTWRQKITSTWEHPKSGYVVDHLTPGNYLPYFDRMIRAFPRPETAIPQSYFIDSWEVETEKLWSDGFANDFYRIYGYDISPFMNSIYDPENSARLYDYMSLISDKVLVFYQKFDSVLNTVDITSRGQVSGAPCDLISGYAKLDVPEGESMLFEPEFCTIPASAALLSGKKVVSSETFTCLYGWPRDYIREEQTADLKLVADALFANGVNQIIWHGKAHNPKGYDTVNFYATTHIGSQGALADEIPDFNNYLEQVSSYMKKGSTWSDIAVYLPVEDAWMAGRMPVEKQFIWAWGYYEMRYVYFPDELAGYSPTWINLEFLEKAILKNGKLKVGDAEYKALYVNAAYLDYRVVKRLALLAGEGLTIILKRDPKEPGTLLHSDYSAWVAEMKKSRHVSTHIPKDLVPFLTGNTSPRHWCRKDGETLYVFFPDPNADRLKFPMQYGQSLEKEVNSMNITLHYQGQSHPLELVFEPYQSLMYKIDNGKVERIDIAFIPKTPVVKERPLGYEAPWLVK